MEAHRSESVVERAYAYLEDMFGLEHDAEAPPTSPEHPDDYTFQTVAEVSADRARRE
jgi:hypothetical protein